MKLVHLLKTHPLGPRLDSMPCTLKIVRAQAKCHARNAQPSEQNLNITLEKIVHFLLGGDARKGFQARKFDGEKYLPRTESKLSSLAWHCNHIQLTWLRYMPSNVASKTH